MRTIQVINQSTSVPEADFRQAVAAVQAQVTEDFAPLWQGAQLVAAQASPNPPRNPAVEAVYVLDNSDQAGALGYHEMTAGVPVGFVFAATAKAAGEDWSVTLSHEVLEQIADPWASRSEITTTLDGRPCAVALEVADAVEETSYAKAGRAVSNFVTPSWFRRGPVSGPLDFLGKLHSPLQLLPGGYIPLTLDLHTWQQVFGQRVPAHRRAPRPHSRVSRILGRNAPVAHSI